MQQNGEDKKNRSFLSEEEQNELLNYYIENDIKPTFFMNRYNSLAFNTPQEAEQFHMKHNPGYHFNKYLKGEEK